MKKIPKLSEEDKFDFSDWDREEILAVLQSAAPYHRRIRWSTMFFAALQGAFFTPLLVILTGGLMGMFLVPVAVLFLNYTVNQTAILLKSLGKKDTDVTPKS